MPARAGLASATYCISEDGLTFVSALPMSSVRGGEKSAGGEDGESVGEAHCVLNYGFECCGVVQVKRSDDFLCEGENTNLYTSLLRRKASNMRHWNGFHRANIPRTKNRECG